MTTFDLGEELNLSSLLRRVNDVSAHVERERHAREELQREVFEYRDLKKLVPDENLFPTRQDKFFHIF